MINSKKASGGREKKGKKPGSGNWKGKKSSPSNIKSRAKRKSLIPEGQEIWNPVTKSWEIEKPTNTKPEKDRRPGSQRNADSYGRGDREERSERRPYGERSDNGRRESRDGFYGKQRDDRNDRGGYGRERRDNDRDNRRSFSNDRNDRRDDRGGFRNDRREDNRGNQGGFSNDRRNDHRDDRGGFRNDRRDDDRGNRGGYSRDNRDRRNDDRPSDKFGNSGEYTSKRRDDDSFKSKNPKGEATHGWRSKWEEFELKDTETSPSRARSREANEDRPQSRSRGFSQDRGDSRSGRSDNRRNDRGRSNSGNNDRRKKGGNKKYGGTDIIPSQLVKKATPVEEKPPYVPQIPFAEFPVDKKIRQALSKRGFEHPTEIQDRTIEAALQGKDLMGIAQTGTGKTAAFLIPIIEKCLTSNDPFTALIMVPTRELALQVQDEFYAIAKGMRLFAEKFIGGTSLRVDFQRLRRRPHVVIGTPGRLVDLTNRGDLLLEEFDILVLDEFDRMLDMGFSHDVMYIADRMTNRNQNMLFSATIDGSVKRLVDQLLQDPVQVKVSSGQSTSENVDQDIVLPVPGEEKLDTLVNMLGSPDFERVILFAETRHKVNKLAKKLNQRGISADEIHGDKTQNARQKALEKFKKGRVQVLVATDVAARGIDVDDVTHVINFEVPRTYDSYVHRIGRTGRAGKTGVALTFVNR